MPLCIVGNQVTHLGFDIVCVTDKRVAEGTSNGSEFFVEYSPDEPSHVAFRPGDRHDGNGRFETPPISQEHQEHAHAVLDEVIELRRLQLRSEHMLTGNPIVARGTADAQLRQEILALARAHQGDNVEPKDPAEVLHSAIHRAASEPGATVHHLPDFVRASVRGYPDGWKPTEEEFVKAGPESYGHFVTIHRSQKK